MIRRFVRSLIHNATVTASNASASLLLDPILMRAMEVRTFEEVEIVNAATGARFATWVEEGGPGEVRVPHARSGEVVAIVSHGLLHDGQTLAHKPRVVTLDASNTVVAITEA